MSEFHTVARVGAIPEGQGQAFAVDGHLVAVFHLGGEYFALNDLCPHMGASLAAGEIYEGTVICPWHGWRFRISDGTWCDSPRIKTDVYEARVLGEEIQVRVAKKEPS